MTLCIILKMLFQKPLMRGQDHHIWNREPKRVQPQKHTGEKSEYILARGVGTQYHCLKKFTMASIKEMFIIPLKEQ